ncbi:PDZ domain-containing protein [bacterium]|nr:PDZ domain-containing protein [bacterium]
MNSAIASRSGGYQGIGFAIPINLVNRIVEDLRSNGRVTRAWLGVYVQAIDATMAKTLGMDKAMGALVGQVVEDSPADDADLKQGDVIIEFDGRDVENSRALPLMVSTQRPNDKKKLKVLRAGKVKTMSVILGELPDEVLAAGPLESNNSDIGINVETPSPERLRFYDISRKFDGVIVNAVDHDSEAYKKNVRVGHLIQKIGPNVRNLEKVNSQEAFDEKLNSYNAGDTILLLVRRDNDNTYFVALTVPE